MKQISHWIDGKPWVGDAQRRGSVFNPATGRQTAEVEFAGETEVDEAVAAARLAFAGWHATSLAKRTSALFSLRDLLARHVDDLADLVTAEHGKVHADAAGEVARGLEVVEFACGISQLLKGEFSEGASTGVNVHSLRQPLGVVAGITPFNFPAMVPLWMFPLALAAGNVRARAYVGWAVRSHTRVVAPATSFLDPTAASVAAAVADVLPIYASTAELAATLLSRARLSLPFDALSVALASKLRPAAILTRDVAGIGALVRATNQTGISVFPL